MFGKLKEFFQDPTDKQESAAMTLDRACASLMVEAAAADGTIAAEERRTLHTHLCRIFKMPGGEADSLIDEVVAQSDHTTHLLRFTRKVKDEMDHDQRLELMEWLWSIVLADNAVDPYEDQLLRRIAGLIYVTDQERGEARKRAEARKPD